MVIGFQYRGKLAAIKEKGQLDLSSAGISGIFDSYKVFQNAANTGTLLVYFTEMGLASFTSCPANELFNQSISLEDIFRREKIVETEERLGLAQTDKERISLIEQFLLSQLREIQADKLVTEAVKLIYQSKGSIRIAELGKQLATSQSPLEKRFRSLVGTTPKKFASIVRFHTVLGDLEQSKSLSDICYEHHFFDQAHFIKDFKHYTGNTPEQFKKGV